MEGKAEKTSLVDDKELEEFLIVETPVGIKVTNLPEISDKERVLRDFFSFCGVITSLSIQEKEATIIFQTPEASRSALLLNGASLPGSNNPISVEPLSGVKSSISADPSVPETNVPIFESLLAEGYHLADTASQQAKQLDDQYQITQRANSVIQPISLKVQELDKQYKFSENCQATFEELEKKIHSVDEEYAIGAGLNQALAAAVTTSELARDVIIARTQEASVTIHESTEDIRNQGETATLSAIASAAEVIESLNLQEKGEAVVATIHNFVEQQPAWSVLQGWANSINDIIVPPRPQ
jgi:hypothetical protein